MSALAPLYADLVAGKSTYFLVRKGQVVEPQHKNAHIVSGSFNPLHDAHRTLFQRAHDLASATDDVAYELSIRRRSKAPLPLDELEARLSQFDHHLVCVTNADFFARKVGALPYRRIVFHIGVDTAQRLLADDELIGVQGINAEFVVYPRDNTGFDTLPAWPDNFNRGKPLPDEVSKLSSTSIRDAQRIAAHELGVIVGKFQVTRLEESHIELVSRVLRQHPRTAICLADQRTKISKTEPLSFRQRETMIREMFPSVEVVATKEMSDDIAWSQHLDAVVDTLSGGADATLYGAHDTFVGSYCGKHRVMEAEPMPMLSGASRATGPDERFTEDFRAGVIYGARDRYDLTLATVDVCLCSMQDGHRYIALGKKPSEPLWRFPGGFSDPALDGSYALGAARELQEEMGVQVDPITVRCIGSMQIDDWRYPGPDRITTTLFMAFADDGPNQLVAADDLEAAKWFHEDDVEAALMPLHKPLWAACARILFAPEVV